MALRQATSLGLLAITLLSGAGAYWWLGSEPTAVDHADQALTQANIPPNPFAKVARAQQAPLAQPTTSGTEADRQEDILQRWERLQLLPEVRAQQISALITAPRSEAVVTLRRVVKAGRDDERLLAIAALQKLAIQHGDQDEAIRNVLRDQIYDGDDRMLQAAQTALEAIDAAVNTR